MFQYNLLRDADIEPLGEGMFRVLEEVGILCQNREMLEALEQRGAVIDYAREVATFPRRMSAKLLTRIRNESQTAEDSGKFHPPSAPGLGTQVAQFVYDYSAKQRRSGNKADFIELSKLGVMLSEGLAGHCLLLTDVPAMIEPLEAAMLLAEYAHKPGPAFAWNVRQADYLIEMGDIYGIPNWFTWGAICIAHPLRFDRDVADRFVRIAKSGASVGLTAMPVAGVTTPVSAAGFIVVAAAEIFAAWLAARALNPDVSLGGSIYGGSINMKTGEVSYSAFDAMFYSFSLAEFLRKWTGKTITVGGGEYCGAREPGYYAALEKAYKAMTIAAFTGNHPSVGQGMLDDGKVLCPVQLMLEREFAAGVRHFDSSVEVSPETMSLDSILDVGFGVDKSYFDTDETLFNFRSHLWCPEFMEREWDGAETDEMVLQRLQNKVNELIANYEKPAVDPDKLAKMRAVVERARKDLLD